MKVPCENCTLCCQGDAVRLLPEDDHGLYMKETHPYKVAELVLAHQENGDCIYLDREKGCTIHAHRPIMCRTMDCRNIYRKIPKQKVNDLVNKGLLKQGVYERGKELNNV